MKNYGLVVDHKELRKAAFAVGFGLFMGKEVANAVSTVAWTMFGKSLVHAAKKLVVEADELKNSTENLTHHEPENSKEDD